MPLRLKVVFDNRGALKGRNSMRNFIAACVIGLAAPVLAQAEVLECDITKNGGWAADKYFFEVDHKAASALVYDAVANHYEGVETKKVGFSESAKKWVFTWKVAIYSKRGDNTRMQYRAAYFPARKELQLRATPGSGYKGEFLSKGNCKVAQP